MKNIYGVQQLLKKFGAFIYTGDRLGDLELMELEINELYHSHFICIEEYELSKLILKREATRLRKCIERRN